MIKKNQQHLKTIESQLLTKRLYTFLDTELVFQCYRRLRLYHRLGRSNICPLKVYLRFYLVVVLV